MEALKIEPADESPSVWLDKGNAIFEISGRSFPEDSANFYSPVLSWIKAYATVPNETTEFTFKLDYSNTASSKVIYDILISLQTVQGVKITWWYNEDEEDMLQAGLELSEQINIPFQFKKYS
jgi:hypothetical protein